MTEPTTTAIPPRRSRPGPNAPSKGGASGAPPGGDAPAKVRKTPPFRETWRYDFPASIVVLLVAIPLCLGIALASGAPLSSGLLAGVIGGIVVGLISDSELMVSGPAAGLTAIVFAGIATLGSFQAFLTATIIGGLLQIGLSLLRAGIIGYYFPSAVIKGMLAGIGVILILKQLPHAVGYDADYEGDLSFQQMDGENTFTALASAFNQVQMGAAIICLVSLAILIAWSKVPALKKLKLMPGPLVVVLVGVALNMLFGRVLPDLEIRATHLVQLPIPESIRELATFFAFPDLGALTRADTWRVGVTIAIVASLETLLSLEATDKIDPFKRESDTNRELLAQGVGNTLAGFIGALPVTGVIVRSAANIDAGARSRWSGISHGVLLLFAVASIPALLNYIPLAALAAILLFVGYKLAAPALWVSLYRLGWQQFIPFAVTVVAIVLTDLLIGIGVGMIVGLFFILSDALRQPALVRVSSPDAVLQRYTLPEHATFLSKANIERSLEALPPGSRVEIDGRNTRRFDLDVVEILHDFHATAGLRNIDYRLVGIPAFSADGKSGH